jgi:hypothetical protein
MHRAGTTGRLSVFERRAEALDMRQALVACRVMQCKWSFAGFRNSMIADIIMKMVSSCQLPYWRTIHALSAEVSA